MCNKGEKFEPGAARYGNFINYYQFNPPENRISLVTCNMLKLAELHNEQTILCLDVGCNTGELTTATHNHLVNSSEECKKELDLCEKQKIIMIGVDVDSILIERAIELNNNPNIFYYCLDIMKDDSKLTLDLFLKQYNKNHFDIVFSFSITMWIHLNYGDSGLHSYLLNLSKYGGNILIEPQPWKCYRNAVRRMKRCNSEQFPEFNKLSIRDSVELEISNFLTDTCNFVKLFETSETKWSRKIGFFKRK